MGNKHQHQQATNNQIAQAVKANSNTATELNNRIVGLTQKVDQLSSELAKVAKLIVTNLGSGSRGTPSPASSTASNATTPDNGDFEKREQK